MEKLAVALFVAMFLATTASAETTGASQIIFQSDKSSVPTAEIFLAHRFDWHGLGFSAFALVVEGWAQFYAGPTWAPADWIEVGLSTGVEQVGSKFKPRFEASVWSGYGPFSFLGIVEFDPKSFKGDDSGVWFDLTPKYQVLDWLAVGAKYRRPVGTGPLIELSLPTTPSAAIWCSWMPIDPEKADGKLLHPARFLVGLQGRF